MLTDYGVAALVAFTALGLMAAAALLGSLLRTASALTLLGAS